MAFNDQPNATNPERLLASTAKQKTRRPVSRRRARLMVGAAGFEPREAMPRAPVPQISKNLIVSMSVSTNSSNEGKRLETNGDHRPAKATPNLIYAFDFSVMN
jgi:hypothetical protein